MATSIPSSQSLSEGTNGRYYRLLREYLALSEISKTLVSTLELEELIDAVMDIIPQVIDYAQIGLVMLWDNSTAIFRPIASFGFKHDIISSLGLRAGESITGKVFDQEVAQLICTPDEVFLAMADMRTANREIFFRSLQSDKLPLCTLAAPITVRNHKYGVLLLGTIYGPEVFIKDDIPFVQTIADLIALAIDRSRLISLADAVREARQAERMRSEIIAILSHELRLPLTAIQGYASALLLDDIDWSDEKQDQFLRMIETESKQMEAILRNLLDSSLIDVDQLVIEPEPTRLSHIAHEIAAEIQHRADIHRIIVDFPANFPILNLDMRWMRQVFRNILDNAIKYSPDGGLIVIRAEVNPHNVLVTVADQGIGISPEDLIPLFEKFFRVRSNPNLRVPGAGLGLPIARNIIEAHGGRIWIESKIGEGTTIHFSLPNNPIIELMDE